MTVKYLFFLRPTTHIGLCKRDHKSGFKCLKWKTVVKGVNSKEGNAYARGAPVFEISL